MNRIFILPETKEFQCLYSIQPLLYFDRFIFQFFRPQVGPKSSTQENKGCTHSGRTGMNMKLFLHQKIFASLRKLCDFHTPKFDSFNRQHFLRCSSTLKDCQVCFLPQLLPHRQVHHPTSFFSHMRFESIP